MAPFEAEITVSDPRFFEAIGNPSGFLPVLAESMSAILGVYQEKASEYAPESEANRPGRFSTVTHEPMGYYERGRGWWYPLLTHNTLGLGQEIPTLRPHLKSPKTMAAPALMAVGFQGVVGYRLRPTSEKMHDDWSTEVQQTAEEVLGYLRNSASYSGLVQGLEQVALHKARAWRTVMDNWDDADMQRVVDDETIRAIDQYYNL